MSTSVGSSLPQSNLARNVYLATADSRATDHVQQDSLSVSNKRGISLAPSCSTDGPARPIVKRQKTDSGYRGTFTSLESDIHDGPVPRTVELVSMSTLSPTEVPTTSATAHSRKEFKRYNIQYPSRPRARNTVDDPLQSSWRNTQDHGLACQYHNTKVFTGVHGQSTPGHQPHNTLKPSRAPVSTSIYAMEVASVAPRYQGSGKKFRLHSVNRVADSTVEPADYHPWTGAHPEDCLSDHCIKSGYSDKISNHQSEQSSARPSIWSSVKHKSGLQILSSLLVSVVDRRESSGTVTLKSTFKPPPRVTLTDNRREAWLRDLADPTISLRRLSRTIPHGVRGKALLDHCLSKKITTLRAVWLARCVGANEMRAFRRQGNSSRFANGGETQWIRDWTSNVESFLISIMDGSKDQDWKERMAYG